MKLFKKKERLAHAQLEPEHAKVLKMIRDALSVDLLKSPYREWRSDKAHPTYGHCYIACEAAYILFAREAGYRTVQRKDEKGGSHWWLRHEDTDEILDPTRPQVEKDFPYEEGRVRSFLPQHPSKRALELIRRVQAAEAKWKQELS